MSITNKKALFESDMDLEFMNRVHAIPGGDAIKRCIQCGTCSGSCAVSWGMDHSPRQIISMVRAGMRDKVLESSTIWTCASCYACTVRCPQEIKITEIMYILKRLAIRVDRRDLLGQVEMQRDVLLADLTAGVGHRVVDDEIQVHRLGLEVGEVHLQRVELDHIVHQTAHALGGGLDALYELPLQRAEDADRFAQQQVGVPDDR